MDSYVDASLMVSDDMDVSDHMPLDYPTPATSTITEPEQPPRKKRKAWGQPVPEINPILPPRKRAKTAEEKEQRKNERILRNRRAADKSRQRQKAAVADLEKRQKDIEEENKQLKQILQQYQSQFGQLPGCEFNPTISESTLSAPTPVSLKDTSSETFPTSLPTPVLSASTPSTSVYQPSPVLAPTLTLNESNMFESSTSLSGMTQYPAVVLCDLQCQPEELVSKIRFMQPLNTQFQTILTLVHCLTIWQAFSTKMHLLMSHVFPILAEILSSRSSTELSTLIQDNFRLIHILISMPMTQTRPAVFRLKLLSRLLACNPSLALLLENAANGALQQTVSEDDWTANADLRWKWASLMTIKQSIRHLEREHHKIRAHVKAGTFDREEWRCASPGVDCGAVEKTARFWDNWEDCNNSPLMIDEECRTMASAEVY
ncbi:hypothetical protein R6Q59_009917 [Mikania micrantha]